MSDKLTATERRRLLALVGSGIATGLAGCGGGGNGDGGGDGGDETTTPTATPTATATATESDGGDGGGGSDTDEVPSAYETATSIGGQQRDPDALSTKEEVNYQSEPRNGNQCSGCQFYIEDKNGDGMGACSIVAGTIDPEGWCVSYSANQG